MNLLTEQIFNRVKNPTGNQTADIVQLKLRLYILYSVQTEEFYFCLEHVVQYTIIENEMSIEEKICKNMYNILDMRECKVHYSVLILLY